MNIIFCRIWNKALGRVVVASELACRKRCGSGRRPSVVNLQRPCALTNGLLAVAVIAGLSVAMPAMAQWQGIYINGGDSDSCTHVRADLAFSADSADDAGVLDKLLRVQRNENCDPRSAASQTNRILFYGTGRGQTASGATSLSIGGRLNVNSGIIGLGQSAPVDRNGNIEGTPSISLGIAIGNSGTSAPHMGIAIGQAARASSYRSVAIGLNAVSTQVTPM